ncbi:MAG: imelysin family protein, partial [Bacteroidota bacterium]
FLQRFISSLLIGAFIFATSCNSGNNQRELESKKAEAVKAYAELVYNNYSDALATAKTMKDAIKAMTDSPSEITLNAARQAWLAAREPYGQSEAFRFYGGPIDNENGPEGRINAWPLDESYIDYVAGASNGDNPADNVNTNIINSPDAFPEITAELIASLNEDGGETNVSSGFHAIEFLLWGQDMSSGAGGGDRSFSDYIVEGAVANSDRRSAYINAVADLLISDLQYLVDEWAPDGVYRAAFTSDAEINNSLEKIISGIGKFSKGELAGERMFVAWDLKSKEDEHSCFSDNTHRDIVTNAVGIENVYLGRYVKTDGSVVDGVGIDEVVAAVNADLDNEMKALLKTTLTSVKAIQAPFDQEILGADTAPGRVRIKTGFNALRAQGDKLAQIASALGYNLNPDAI